MVAFSGRVWLPAPSLKQSKNKNMATHNIEFQKTVTDTVSVELPCFVRFSEVYYKMYKNKAVTQVSDFGFSMSIEHSKNINPFGNEPWSFIEEDEFNAAFDRVMKFLCEKQGATNAVL